MKESWLEPLPVDLTRDWALAPVTVTPGPGGTVKMVSKLVAGGFLVSVNNHLVSMACIEHNSIIILLTLRHVLFCVLQRSGIGVVCSREHAYTQAG